MVFPERLVIAERAYLGRRLQKINRRGWCTGPGLDPLLQCLLDGDIVDTARGHYAATRIINIGARLAAGGAQRQQNVWPQL